MLIDAYGYQERDNFQAFKCKTFFKTFNCEGEIHMFKSKKYEVGSTEGLLMYVHTYIYTLRMKCVCTYIHDGHFAPNH